MPIIGSGNSGLTVAQVFQQKGLWAWWTQNNGYGTNPYNGVSEKGIDYSSGIFGTPIGVPVGGKIVRSVHNNNSIGDVVELRADDGSVWLYQHITAKAAVGQTLNCASVIGTQNGLPVDQYSTGTHIEVRYCPPGQWNPSVDSWNEPWVNPYKVFASIGDQPAGQTGGLIGESASQPLGDSASKVADFISPNADVTIVLGAIDQTFSLINPFNVSTANDIMILGQDTGVANPIDWIAGFGTNVISDMTALVLRMILIIIGVFVLYKVASNFIDFGAIGSTIGSLGQSAGDLAVLAA